MRASWFGLLFLLLPALASAGGMGYDDARHLLGRTGFAPTDSEIRQFAVLTRTAAVDRLLDGVHASAGSEPPPEVLQFISPRQLRALRKDASEEERKAFLREQVQRSLELRAWWLKEMLDTDSPLTEKMTLFWHNHFVSSQQKVKSPVLMYRQNLLLRRYALGRFGDLLHAVARDPAMVLYLDNASNRKGNPNENFAREVMELFTLGEGHYTEQDIKEAARAFTGWGIDRNTGGFRFYPRQHDDGEKTVLGRSGRLSGDDVLDILLAQPATAEFITAKLWREFVSPQPDAVEVRRLATVFRDSGYDIRALLRAMLTSEPFFAARNRSVLVKSPVEFVVGTLRQFDIHPADLRPAALVTRGLGQDLFAPPNVKGWPGGETWINSSTLLARRQFLARLFRAAEMPVEPEMKADARPEKRLQLAMRRAARDYRFDASTWFANFPGSDEARRAAIARLLLPGAPVEPPAPDETLRGYVASLVRDPLYELK